MYMRLNATGFEACDASDLQAALDDDAMKFRRYDPPKVDNTIISASTKIVGSVVLALIGAVLALLV